MVRHFKPHTMLEVGSGHSSLISGQATARKWPICAHLYRGLSAGVPPGRFPRAAVAHPQKDRGARAGFFAATAAVNVVSIDSSHTDEDRGDVNDLSLDLGRKSKCPRVPLLELFLEFENECAFSCGLFDQTRRPFLRDFSGSRTTALGAGRSLTLIGRLIR